MQYCIHTKSHKWNQNVINFLVREKLTSFLKYICYIYVHKSFSTTLDKGLKKNILKKEKIEKLENKLNETRTLNMK